jgi:hypothetical protein
MIAPAAGKHRSVRHDSIMKNAILTGPASSPAQQHEAAAASIVLASLDDREGELRLSSTECRSSCEGQVHALRSRPTHSLECGRPALPSSALLSSSVLLTMCLERPWLEFTPYPFTILRFGRYESAYERQNCTLLTRGCSPRMHRGSGDVGHRCWQRRPKAHALLFPPRALRPNPVGCTRPQRS